MRALILSSIVPQRKFRLTAYIEDFFFLFFIIFNFLMPHSAQIFCAVESLICTLHLM